MVLAIGREVEPGAAAQAGIDQHQVKGTVTAAEQYQQFVQAGDRGYRVATLLIAVPLQAQALVVLRVGDHDAHGFVAHDRPPARAAVRGSQCNRPAALMGRAYQ